MNWKINLFVIYGGRVKWRAIKYSRLHLIDDYNLENFIIHDSLASHAEAITNGWDYEAEHRRIMSSI
jgi:hypothetical protein